MRMCKRLRVGEVREVLASRSIAGLTGSRSVVHHQADAVAPGEVRSERGDLRGRRCEKYGRGVRHRSEYPRICQRLIESAAGARTRIVPDGRREDELEVDDVR